MTTDFFSPYVDPVYAYTFGRSKSYLSYRTIGSAFQEIAHRHPDRDYVVSRHQGIKRTYAELLTEVDRFGKALVDTIGIRRGDVVAMWSANLYEFFVVQLAVARIGAVYCSVSPLYKTAELEHLLTSAKVKALVYPGPESMQNFVIDYNGTLEAAKKPYLRDLIYLESDEGPGTGNSGLRSHSLRYLVNNNDGVIDQGILNDVEPDDIANIFFTSGTTGKPKGAATSHATVMNCQRLMLRSKANVTDEDEIRVCCP